MNVNKLNKKTSFNLLPAAGCLLLGLVFQSGAFADEAKAKAEVKVAVKEVAEKAKSPPAAQVARAKAKVYSAGGHEFLLEEVLSVDEELWSMALLPTGMILATQKDGGLWIYENGTKKSATKGLPRISSKGQGGLLDIKLDPDFNKNQIIYLTYSSAKENGAMTKLVRGRLRNTLVGTKWLQMETLFSAKKETYTESPHHFGSRIAFKDGTVFFTIGDRGKKEQAQDLSLPNGKVHRVPMPGLRVEDNPFMKTEKALPSIWSYGHRNPQGLAVHPVTGDLWSAEHGPKGGDEVNVILKGANYGWPLVTYGVNYNGTTISDKTEQEGIEPPKHYWVPSIAVSDIDFYTGSLFPKWTNQMLVSSLAKEELHLLKIDGTKVTSDDILLKGLGRIRDVTDGPMGYPHIIVQKKGGKGSIIYRLAPVKNKVVEPKKVIAQ